ncbi:MAG: sugar kinase [Candidatus Marinimicrobia bacterium]|nr:sugar kinase [Candidatus Neomarinimicrobiota bacterium]|tara:strand:- start:1700 stop:2596 length:897 start_codon:yes stop_codon:yes gene_type:complete
MSHNSILIVGSIAMDTIETPFEKRSNVIGGSTTYSLVASGKQSEVSIVGIVGNDFPSDGHSLYQSYASDLSDLKIAEGKTFRWGGRYHENWDDRDTLFTDLGVFSDFRPVLNESNKNRSHILLANIHPELQRSVIQQNQNPDAIIVIDTMNLWIETTLSSLEKVLSDSNILLINESEAFLLTNENDINNAARSLLKMGPEVVVIKKGSRGAELFSLTEHIAVDAFPVTNVVDPTGAGDVFAGAFVASLANEDSKETALLYASASASISIESFGIEKLQSASNNEINDRINFLNKTLKS